MPPNTYLSLRDKGQGSGILMLLAAGDALLEEGSSSLPRRIVVIS